MGAFWSQEGGFSGQMEGGMGADQAWEGSGIGICSACHVITPAPRPESPTRAAQISIS